MSSQKQKTPAEELMDSLLNEVENSDNLSKSGFALNLERLAPEESSEEGAVADDNAANRTLVATSVADEEDSEIQGIVNFDPTVVGSMSFEGLLKNKKNDKTEVRPSMAKTEVRPELAKTEVRPSNQSTVVKPQSETAIIGQEFSSEEASAYEATRVGAPPQVPGEENQHTEFGELELEPMEAKVVDLQALELAEQQSDEESDNEDFLKTEIRPAQAMMQPPTPPGKVPASEQPVSPAEMKAAMSLFSSSDAPAEPLTPPVMQASPEPLDENVKTQVIPSENPFANQSSQANPDSPVGAARAPEEPRALFSSTSSRSRAGDSEGTVAVTGFQIKSEDNLEGKVKVSIGKPGRSSSGYSSWGGGVDSNLSQAENLRMAQEKILALENENEKLRRQNEELIAASEILKERSDLMTSQLTEYKNDREGLEQSFKNEMTLLKNHVARKDAELRRAQIKVEELESRLKFDLKKIRVRERELENRLELVRAEKNAISKNKDEQILDLRRKMDLIQMEVDSYRQKCIELNKQIETSQDSFKRTTRALRLAMANLELQEENKGQLKKAE